MRPGLRCALLAAAAILAACGGGGGTYKGQSVSAYVKSVQRLRDPDFQRSAITELGRDGAAADPAWIGLLRCDDPPLVEMTASRLGQRLPGKRRLPLSQELRTALLDATGHADAGVRATAVWAVGRQLSDDAGVLPNLAAALGDSDPRVVRAALGALRGREPDSGAPDLARVREIAAKRSDLSVEACLALAAHGDAAPETVDRLAACAADGTPPAHAVDAVRALANLGSAATRAAPRLVAAFAGETGFRARDLADTLGLLGDSSEPVLAALRRGLDHKEATVRTSAALALLRLGQRDARTEGILTAGFGSGNSFVSLRSAEGLLLLDRDAGKAWPVLVSALAADADGFGAGEEAARALGRLAAAGKALPPDALAAIEWAATANFPEVRRAATAARAKIAPK